ncbi:MAG: hypothetical protein AB7E76_03290 [Deferribacterales bacterium]
MELFRWVLLNRLHYKGKTVVVGFLCGFLMFAAAASAVLMKHVARQAEKPLKALNTGLIMQKTAETKQTDGFKTGGLITPFDMENFSAEAFHESISGLNEVKEYSSALLLWKLDTRGTLVIAGIKKDEPAVGLRNIETMLFKGVFFSADDADEVILERHYAAFFGYEMGGVFELQGVKLRIAGIVDFTDQSNLSTASVFLPYETAVKLAGVPSGYVNQIYAALTSASETESFAEKAGEIFPGFTVVTKDSLYKNLKGISGLMLSFGKAVTAVLSSVGLVLIVFLLKIHSYDFRRNRDTLKMLGWPPSLVRSWLAADTAVILGAAVIFCTLLTVVFIFAALPAFDVAPMVQEAVL